MIEQPPPMPDGRALPLDILSKRLPHELVAGLSRDLDGEMVENHITLIRESLEEFNVMACDSRDRIVAALSQDDLEIVYFLCHGKYDDRHEERAPLPFLEVGEEERIFPQDIVAWTEGLWPEDHWEITSPLVFINGCHTAAFTPESLLNFIDVFINANASGVIGTEIQVHERLATEVAETFFRYLTGKLSVGDALRRTRIHLLRKGNLLGLAYTPYCSANLKISLLARPETGVHQRETSLAMAT
jgi:CHAT domain-containing protein